MPQTTAPQIIGTQGDLLGWRRQHEIKVSESETERVWRGPVSQFSTVWATLLAEEGADAWDFTASRSVGSQVAEIRAVKKSSPNDDPSSLDDLKIAEDTFSLDPVSMPTALEAHPKFADESVLDKILAMRDCMDRGDRAAARAMVGDQEGGDAHATWLRLYANGVRTFDAIAWHYRCVRHYSADSSHFSLIQSELSADMQNVLKVYEWGDVEGTGDAPFGEPMWWDTSAADGEGAAASYEWRFDGISFGGTADELTVSWCYTGVWKWAEALYDGGTWEPELP